MSIVITIVVVGALLFAYTVIEKRIGQRACPSCGFRVSKDAPGGCPSCRSESSAGSKPDHPWLRLGFLGLACLCIPLTVVLVVLLDRPRSEIDRAIRLVQESSSRIENFTIQQYLYTTVYKDRDDGKPVTIGGWRAEQPGGPHTEVKVEFRFAKSGAQQVAIWDVSSGHVTPANQAARDMSWNY